MVEEVERLNLWRGIVRQTRRITLDGPLPPRIELEPVASLTSLTRWTSTDDAAVIDPASYHYVTRDPARHRNRALALVLMAQPRTINRKSFSLIVLRMRGGYGHSGNRTTAQMTRST